MLLWSCMGEGDFRCSLNLSPNVLEDSPIYSSSQSTLSQWYLYMTPLCFSMESLSFGAIRRFLMVVPPLQCTCTPKFLANVFDVFTEPYIIRYHYIRYLSDVTVVVDCGSCAWVSHLVFDFVQGPIWVLTSHWCLLQVFFFFL